MNTAKILISIFLTSILTGCVKGNQTDKVITLDLKASHPKKELILQDFMDVEYIPLETTDEFVTQGDVMAIGEKYILVKNWNRDGDIFVFDRKTGKGIRKINRFGQGAEEYPNLYSTILDEKNNEIFVNSSTKIFVYDLSGNFKRSFNQPEGSEYLDIYDYDENNLIGYDMSASYNEGEKRDKDFYHAIISKNDGSLTKGITIPFDIIRSPCVKNGDGVAVSAVRSIIPEKDNWILVETSSDTVYKYIPKENRLTPLLIKAPTKDPEILLTMGAITDQYYFLAAIEKVFDFEKMKGFYNKDLVYDRKENKLYEVMVYNNDCTSKLPVEMTSHPVNGNIAAFQRLAVDKLVEAYNKGELKGSLKEVASKLDEESNPVIMIMKYK